MTAHDKEPTINDSPAARRRFDGVFLAAAFSAACVLFCLFQYSRGGALAFVALTPGFIVAIIAERKAPRRREPQVALVLLVATTVLAVVTLVAS